MFQNLDTESRLQLLEREDVWNTIMKLLHMLGIDANPSVLKTSLTNIKTATGITFTDPITLLLPQLNIISVSYTHLHEVVARLIGLSNGYLKTLSIG